jgi:hypothetical protein
VPCIVDLILLFYIFLNKLCDKGKRKGGREDQESSIGEIRKLI